MSKSADAEDEKHHALMLMSDANSASGYVANYVANYEIRVCIKIRIRPKYITMDLAT